MEGDSAIAFYCLKVAFLVPAFFYFYQKGYLSNNQSTRFNKFSKILFIVWTLYYFVLPFWHIEITPNIQIFVLTLLYTTFTVTFEEIVFRVIPFKTKEINPISNFRIIKYALLFAVAHAANILYTGSLIVTFIQVIIAFGYGAILSVGYLRTNSILYIIALHLFVNFPQEYVIISGSLYPSITSNIKVNQISIEPLIFSGIFSYVLWLISSVWRKDIL